MSPLDILKDRWALTMPIPFAEVVNTQVTTDQLPERWGTAFEDSNTRTDLTMGSNPWVMEEGNLVAALFCKSGIGRSALDDAIAALRGAFHGYQTPDHQFHFVSVVGPAADDNEGIGEWHRLTFIVNYTFRTRRSEPPYPVDPLAPNLPGP